jgi:hypothetical protein
MAAVGSGHFVDDPTALSMAGVLARQMGLQEASVRRAKMRS